MPTIDLDPMQSRVALLAIQKRNAARANAQSAFNAAEAQFLADIDVLVTSLKVPDVNTAVNFHVENGKGTASWPDITPTADTAAEGRA